MILESWKSRQILGNQMAIVVLSPKVIRLVNSSSEEDRKVACWLIRSVLPPNRPRIGA